MAFQTVFKRYELKYLLTAEDAELLRSLMAEHMEPDRYGKSTIRNIYYDTDTYRLVRHSIEKPIYKEKLRVRSYAAADNSSTVFVELKKKYDGVVYKRRLSLPLCQAERWLSGLSGAPLHSQISDEIDYFLSYYATLRPRVYLSYEREAFFLREDKSFRVTFDRNILARTDELSLSKEVGGRRILADGSVLMEIKCAGGMPLWMAHFLSEQRIYKTSFSKYGEAYKAMILSAPADGISEGLLL